MPLSDRDPRLRLLEAPEPEERLCEVAGATCEPAVRLPLRELVAHPAKRRLGRKRLVGEKLYVTADHTAMCGDGHSMAELLEGVTGRGEERRGAVELPDLRDEPAQVGGHDRPPVSRQ